MSIAFRATVFLSVTAFALCCNFDSDCNARQACSGSDGICYWKPSSLHEYCTKDKECHSIDIWSECRSHSCQCWTSKYERDGGCWSTGSSGPGDSAPDSSIILILTFTLIPLAVFLTLLVGVIHVMRRRNAAVAEAIAVRRSAAAAAARQAGLSMGGAGFSFPASITAVSVPPPECPVGFIPPPPPPSYSESQRVSLR